MVVRLSLAVLVTFISAVTASGALCTNRIAFNNKSLQNSRFSALKVAGVFVCSYLCLADKRCKSFSFEKQTQLCSLNSEDSTSSVLKSVNGSEVFYSDIAVWPKKIAGVCATQPCPKFSMCTVSRNYSTLCVQSPLGKECSSNVECTNFGQAQCVSNQCVCGLGFYLEGGGTQCSPVVKAPCVDDKDCNVLSNSICNNLEETCTCAMGYSFDSSQGICRPNQDCLSWADEFTRYDGIAIDYYDREVIANTTFDECSELCLNASSFVCKAFEYKVMHGLAPAYIHDMIVPYKWSRVPGSAQQLQLVVPAARTTTDGDRTLKQASAVL